MEEIPKVVYQTWRTKTDIPDIIQKQREEMMNLNSNYEFKLYDDLDMEKFVHENFDGDIVECWNKLNIMTAKADFWRYLILYKYGGIYLDFDSIPLINFDKIIKIEYDSIIGIEKNLEYCAQFVLFFCKNHPILKETINEIIKNIKNGGLENSVWHTTGPLPFTIAIQCVYVKEYKQNINFSNIIKKNIKKYNIDDYNYHFLFFDKFFKCIYKKYILYNNQYLHWRDEQKIKTILKNGA
jgi:mannosyltransferase OCH1-like enzyme